MDNAYSLLDGGCGPGLLGAGMPNYWVNTATLDLFLQDTIFSYQGLGPPIEITLSYVTGTKMRGIFGNNWRLLYEAQIIQQGETVHLWKGSGQRLDYLSSASAASVNDPVDLISQQPISFDRLLDYGQYWLFWEKRSFLNYRFDKVPGSDQSRLTAISDANGNYIQIAFNPDGNIRAIIDAAGRETVFSYNANHLCTEFTTPDGHSAYFTYDQGGYLTRAVDLIEEPVIYEYDQAGYIKRLIAASDQRTTTFDYSSGPNGQCITQITDASGHATRYELLSDKPRQVRVTDPEGGATTYISNDGYTEKVIDGLGHAKIYRYAGGRRTSIQDKNGQITQLTYDPYGNLVATRDPLGHTFQFTYDNHGFLTSAKNPLGETWQYEYDQNHNLLRVVLPLGTESYQYDQRGLLVSATDPNNHTTHYQYDLFGNISAITDALGNIRQMRYDPSGLHLQSISDPLGNCTQFEHDANGRLTTTTWPDGTMRTYGYDCCAGNSFVDENGEKTTLRRDSLLNITEYHYPGGNRQIHILDKNGDLRRFTDALGRTTYLDLDGLGQIIKITDPLGGTVAMQYDPTGNLLLVNNENGQPISYQYDPLGALIGSVDALGKRLTFERDALSRITVLKNGRGSQVNINYNAAGQRSEVSFDGEHYATYQYDLASNLIQVQDSLGSTRYQYTPLNLVDQIQYPGDLTVSFEYDGAGQLSAFNYPNGLRLTYNYDNRGRVIDLGWDGGSVEYQYDGADNLLRERRSNQTESSYQYNRGKLLTKIIHTKAGQVFASTDYQRDAAGNITEQQGFGFTQEIFPQKASQASYNQLNQILTLGQERYNYDHDGNLTAVSGGSWQANYDPHNRLTKVTRQNQTSNFVYNGLGYRAQIINDQTQRNFFYDLAGNLLFESDQNNQVTALYIYLGNLLVARLDENGDALYYHFDHLGSTIALSDDQGEIAATYAYDPFGQVLNPAPQTTQPFTYVGRFGVQDDGEGLFYMRNRHYDAKTRRFLQKDPLGIKGGVNFYAYVGNDPVNFIDPEGLFPQAIQQQLLPPSYIGGDTPRASLHPSELANFGSDVHLADKLANQEMLLTVLDRVATYTPGINLPYGLIKAEYLIQTGKRNLGVWEGIKTSLGPVGTAIQVIEDVRDLKKFFTTQKEPFLANPACPPKTR